MAGQSDVWWYHSSGLLPEEEEEKVEKEYINEIY